jgi:segregation and condensation protein B
MERSEQRRILEALVLSAPEPMPAGRLASVVPGATPSLVQELVSELNGEYEAQERGFEIHHVAGGYQLRTRPDLAEHVRALQPRRAVRLSRASLETLAVIAYRQPVTRAEIEHVRGVDAGAVARTLLERNLVRIAGHREIPGRPMLYATTKRFLEVFGLASLEDLPTLREIEELLPSTAARGEGEGDASAEEDAGGELVEEGESEEECSAPALFGSFESAYAEPLDEEEDALFEDEDEDEIADEDAGPRGEPH